jgi:magnesium chelatase subunit H
MLDRLRDLNPHSAHALVQRLLEANGRGYWDIEPDVLQRLRDISRDLEDQLEGIV